MGWYKARCSIELTSIMHSNKKIIEICHGSKNGIDVTEVFHIIAKVLHWGLVEWADPNNLDVQVSKMIQFLNNAC